MKHHLLQLLMITFASTFVMSTAFANPVYPNRHSYSYSVNPHYQPQHGYSYPQYQHSYEYSDYGHNNNYYNDHSPGYSEYETYDHAPTIIIETFSGGLHY